MAFSRLSLSMNPLKQGLKHLFCHGISSLSVVFIHESIKTRVETYIPVRRDTGSYIVFIHESIKTRVETSFLDDGFGS